MLLYYGADRLVQRPVYNKGNPSNDYGLGFYLTPEKEMARLWASKNRESGYCITYDVEISGMNICRFDDTGEENILQWIGLLVAHRFSREEYETFRPAIEWLRKQYPERIDADMIIGYRADDSYFAYSRDFVANELSLETLGEAMKIGKLGLQYVLKSRKSFESIQMVDYEIVEPSGAYNQFRAKALSDYHALKRNDSIDNTFIRDLMRQRR